MKKSAVGLICWIGLGVATSHAGNGHMLHGFGPVNSSMGGAGVALAADPVGALMVNPALLASMEGNHGFITFGSEFFEDSIEIDTGKGSAGYNEDLGVLPAIGFTTHPSESPWSFGFGLVAVAGFRTDYPDDKDNPIFFDTGAASYSVTKIPLAFSYRAHEKVSVGLSVNIFRGSLGLNPLPPPVPNLNGQPELSLAGDKTVGAMGVGFSAGFYYELNSKLSFGFNYESEQAYEDYEWKAVYNNPNQNNRNMKRKIRHELDGPQIVTFGFGFKPNEKVRVAADAKWMNYADADGFNEEGSGALSGLYWDDIWGGSLGAEYELSKDLELRAGYNYSESPMPAYSKMNGFFVPAVTEHLFSAGIGLKVSENVTLNVTGYVAPEETMTVKTVNPNNQNQAQSFKLSQEVLAALAGIEWIF